MFVVMSHVVKSTGRVNQILNSTAYEVGETREDAVQNWAYHALAANLPISHVDRVARELLTYRLNSLITLDTEHKLSLIQQGEVSKPVNREMEFNATV